MSEALALTGWLDAPVRRLSLGTRQKVGLVGALAHEPNVVVLDEPTNGLDLSPSSDSGICCGGDRARRERCW